MSTSNQQTTSKTFPAFVGGLAAGVIVGAVAGAFLPDRAIGAGMSRLRLSEASSAPARSSQTPAPNPAQPPAQASAAAQHQANVGDK